MLIAAVAAVSCARTDPDAASAEPRGHVADRAAAEGSEPQSPRSPRDASTEGTAPRRDIATANASDGDDSPSSPGRDTIELCGLAKRHPRGAPAAAPTHMQAPAFEVRAGVGTRITCDEAINIVEEFISYIREQASLRGWTCRFGEAGAEPVARCTSPDGQLLMSEP